MSKQQSPGTLELVSGNAVVETIEVKPGEGDFPWYSGAFHPDKAYEAGEILIHIDGAEAWRRSEQGADA